VIGFSIHDHHDDAMTLLSPYQAVFHHRGTANASACGVIGSSFPEGLPGSGDSPILLKTVHLRLHRSEWAIRTPTAARNGPTDRTRTCFPHYTLLYQRVHAHNGYTFPSNSPKGSRMTQHSRRAPIRDGFASRALVHSHVPCVPSRVQPTVDCRCFRIRRSPATTLISR
jgi:hypothetical protein